VVLAPGRAPKERSPKRRNIEREKFERERIFFIPFLFVLSQTKRVSLSSKPILIIK